MAFFPREFKVRVLSRNVRVESLYYLTVHSAIFFRRLRIH